MWRVTPLVSPERQTWPATGHLSSQSCVCPRVLQRSPLEIPFQPLHPPSPTCLSSNRLRRGPSRAPVTTWGPAQHPPDNSEGPTCTEALLSLCPLAPPNWNCLQIRPFSPHPPSKAYSNATLHTVPPTPSVGLNQQLPSPGHCLQPRQAKLLGLGTPRHVTVQDLVSRGIPCPRFCTWVPVTCKPAPAAPLSALSPRRGPSG